MKLILLVFILYLLFHGSGYYGYRRGHYGGGCFGCLSLFLLLLVLMALFGGPYLGWYSFGYYHY